MIRPSICKLLTTMHMQMDTLIMKPFIKMIAGFQNMTPCLLEPQLGITSPTTFTEQIFGRQFGGRFGI